LRPFKENLLYQMDIRPARTEAIKEEMMKKR
jgi:hypothetical protein